MEETHSSHLGHYVAVRRRAHPVVSATTTGLQSRRQAPSREGPPPTPYIPQELIVFLGAER